MKTSSDCDSFVKFIKNNNYNKLSRTGQLESVTAQMHKISSSKQNHNGQKYTYHHEYIHSPSISKEKKHPANIYQHQ